MIKNVILNPVSNRGHQKVRNIPIMLKFSTNTLDTLTFDYTAFTNQTYNQLGETKGLSIGDNVANFTVLDHTGKKQELFELLTKGKVIVIFYRGQWCPFCMPFVRKIQKELLSLYVRGASVLLVSPEKQEQIRKTRSKTETTIPIIHDQDYRLMNLFDVSFKPNRMEKFLFNFRLGANLKKAHSDTSQTLPIPATFIIDQNRTIKWRHFNKNFKLRASIKEIIKNL